jgi:hypothetical protein
MSLGKRMDVTAHFFDRPQCPRRHLQPESFSQQIGCEVLALYVRKPRPARFLLGERIVVTVLLHFAVEETQLRPFERLRDDIEKSGCCEHGAKVRRDTATLSRKALYLFGASLEKMV